MKKDSRLIIYHAGCTDGFGAAWSFWHRFYDTAEYYPGVYKRPPPDVTDKDVYVVDFSYTPDVLTEMCKYARSVTVIDHHKDAMEALLKLKLPNLRVIFDNTRSGAVLCWQYCFPGEPIPQILLHIEDRDLWKFELQGTKEIVASLYSMDFDFDAWSKLDLNMLFVEGKALLRAQAQHVKHSVKNKRQVNIKGYDVWMSNAPPWLASDLGHELAAGLPFAATYYDAADTRIFSLRSDPNGIDVSAIARQYGGNGHFHAAGFSIPLGAAL